MDVKKHMEELSRMLDSLGVDGTKVVGLALVIDSVGGGLEFGLKMIDSGEITKKEAFIIGYLTGTKTGFVLREIAEKGGNGENKKV